jgi:hypothetical protein
VVCSCFLISQNTETLQGNRSMGKLENILVVILRGSSDNNLSFSDLRFTLESLGFVVRIKGDHFIYTNQSVTEIINIQPAGNKAKAYQVKQVRSLILKYKLAR